MQGWESECCGVGSPSIENKNKIQWFNLLYLEISNFKCLSSFIWNYQKSSSCFLKILILHYQTTVSRHGRDLATIDRQIRGRGTPPKMLHSCLGRRGGCRTQSITHIQRPLVMCMELWTYNLQTSILQDWEKQDTPTFNMTNNKYDAFVGARFVDCSRWVNVRALKQQQRRETTSKAAARS